MQKNKTEIKAINKNNFSEIEITAGKEAQVVLSGTLENYVEAYVLDVHLIHPDGTDELSHLYASSDGFYYLPIIIDDTWVSGTYTAYVQFREFMDDASTFTIINNSIKDDSVDLELIESFYSSLDKKIKEVRSAIKRPLSLMPLSLSISSSLS